MKANAVSLSLARYDEGCVACRFRRPLSLAFRCQHFANIRTGFHGTAFHSLFAEPKQLACKECVSGAAGTMSYMQRPRLVNRGSAVRVCYPAFIAGSRGNTADQHPAQRRLKSVVANGLPTSVQNVGENPCTRIERAGHPTPLMLAAALSIVAILGARAGGVL